MKKKRPNSEMPNANNPEWTEETFKRAVPFSALAKKLQKVIAGRKRGPQKAPKKQLVSIRLSKEVIEHFKAGGPGWQTRIDEELKKKVRRAG